VSFIGMLEQFSLSAVLQKIEGEAKSGILIIKREGHWVELSFRQGHLMCVGPVRSNTTIGDRLLQAGVISHKAIQEISSTLGASLQNETRTVVTLINLGFLNQDSLYIWAAQEATKILQVLLSWTTGEMYFEEGLQPPPDRLLIALTVSSLVPLQSLVTPAQSASADPFSSIQLHNQSKYRTASSQTTDAITLHDPSHFYSAFATQSASNSRDFNQGYTTDAVRNTDALTYSATPFITPQRLTEPLTPKRINTTFMHPQMVLNPTDLSPLRDQNLHVQLTPEQWRLFTVADSKTTLQMACQQLVMSREQVCQVAGELIALGLVNVSLPDSGSMYNLNPFLLDLANAGFSASHVTQAQSNRDFSTPPVETHSQWGNGGTGATFVLGNGWVVASSPSQSLQSSEPYNSSRIEYAEASGIH
jgi:uncharacterized protein DUF4388